jgi:hypothetical protein
MVPGKVGPGSVQNQEKAIEFRLFFGQHFVYLFILAILGFELRVSHLLGRRCTT